MTKTDKIVKAIGQASKTLGIRPQEVTRKHVIDTGLITEWDIKATGGLEAIKKQHFPITDKELAEIRKTKLNNSYVSKLETQVAQKQILAENFRELIESIVLPIPKKRKTVPVSKGAIKREVVGMLNDTHVGLIVDSDEVNGTNSFDFKEAGRRFALYVKEVAEYKIEKRKEVNKLHLVLNGDNLAGIIHGLETRGIHLLGYQLNGLLHILVYALDYLLDYYPRIDVHGIAGNHSRRIHKNGGGRAVSEVYDSYENDVLFALSAVFRKNNNITFNFPKTPYGFIDLPAGRAAFVHGDHIFSKALGNPGTTINVKALSEKIKDFNSGEVAKGNPPVKLILFAHVHTFAHFITNDGVEVYIAPSLVGLDQYAHSLTINNNFIAQVVFESTPDFILGDSRLIRLNAADNNKSLETIIPEYKKTLKWQKNKI